MTAVTAFGSKKFGAQIRFLSLSVLPKKLKTKISIKNGMILILKPVLKECCTWKWKSSLKKKNKHKHKTEHKTEHETKHKTEHETPICVQYF